MLIQYSLDPLKWRSHHGSRKNRPKYWALSLSASVKPFHLVFKLFVEFKEIAHFLIWIGLHVSEQLLRVSLLVISLEFVIYFLLAPIFKENRVIQIR